MGELATEALHICGIGNGNGMALGGIRELGSRCSFRKPRLLRDMITLLISTKALVINFTHGVEMRSRVPRPSTSSSAADFDKQGCFKSDPFLMFPFHLDFLLDFHSLGQGCWEGAMTALRTPHRNQALSQSVKDLLQAIIGLGWVL